MVKSKWIKELVVLPVVTAVLLVAMTVVVPGKTLLVQSVNAEDVNIENAHDVKHEAKAPIATSGDNVYIVWWSNKTGNDEIMFRASTDNGKTFGSPMNISNSSDAHSLGARIAADQGSNVYISWVDIDEKTGQKQVLFRASNNNGQAFGNPVMLNSTTTGR